MQTNLNIARGGERYMKRSIIAITVAIFFAVAGLVVLQHSEYSRTFADNQESNTTLYSVNCEKHYSFQAPTAMNFDLAVTLGTGADRGNHAFGLTFNSMPGALLNEQTSDWSANSSLTFVEDAGNIKLQFIAGSMALIGRCMPTATKAASGLKGSYSNTELISVKYNNQESDASSATYTQELQGASASVSLDPTMESDESTAFFGKEGTNPLVLQLEFDADYSSSVGVRSASVAWVGYWNN